MASTTPCATPEVTVAMPFESPFNSKSLLITVSKQRVPFSVHEAKLAQTAFFKVHSPISPNDRFNHEAAVTLQSSNSPSITESTANAQRVTIKCEDGVARPTSGLTPDFHVEDKFILDADSFNIFVKYLYNEPPGIPTSRKEVKSLLMAYGIAVNYNCYDLQNKIIDCVRAYHARTKVRLDDLVWACNRLGDSSVLQLNVYLVDQVAYEIADGGFSEFAATNGFMETFLKEGNRSIRIHLFKALAQHAQNSPAPDPASDRKRYHVYEDGSQAGQPRL